MTSAVHARRSRPEFPEWLATSAAIAELAKMRRENEQFRRAFAPRARELRPTLSTPTGYEPPALVSREVLASGDDAETFGWQLEARAWQLGFPAAERQAFVADGSGGQLEVCRTTFPSRHADPRPDARA